MNKRKIHGIEFDYAAVPLPTQKSFLQRQAPKRIKTPTTATKQITMAAIIPASAPTEPVAVSGEEQSTAAILPRQVV